jgi:hypothetical protein
LKTVYRIFSKVWFLNFVATITTAFTLQMTIVGIINIVENGTNYYLNDHNFIIVIFFLIYLVFDIWILTSTFLPVIKINANGIFAYSIFWKRKILWTEMKSAKLLKTKNRHLTGRASIVFEFTEEPEAKNALIDKRLRVNIFIIISKKIIKKPESFSLSGQLLSHKKMTTIEEITFEYDEEAWKIIQNKVKQ